jgi:hypothetical protein
MWRRAIRFLARSMMSNGEGLSHVSSGESAEPVSTQDEPERATGNEEPDIPAAAYAEAQQQPADLTIPEQPVAGTERTLIAVDEPHPQPAERQPMPQATNDIVAEARPDGEQVADLPEPAFFDGPIPEPMQLTPFPTVDDFEFPAPDGWKPASECTTPEIIERNRQATLAGRDLKKIVVTGVLP